jgi:large subunit ribosomal protein L35
MPKLKTNKAISKRVTMTKSGKFKFKRAGGRHKMASKSAKRARSLRKREVVSKGDHAVVAAMLPYGLP